MFLRRRLPGVESAIHALARHGLGPGAHAWPDGVRTRRRRTHARTTLSSSGLAVPQYPSFQPLGTDPVRPEREPENIIRTC